MHDSPDPKAAWPALPYDEWQATRDTLHMYAQVIGKLRLALSPFEPQWAHVALYVTARGLTTSPVPAGSQTFDAELDLIGHELVLRSSSGAVERRPLGGDVADFYSDVMRMLGRMGIEVAISIVPSEVKNPIPFPEDRTHGTYDRKSASRFFEVLAMVDAVMKKHRGQFLGRTSPVQFFWGSFDLALIRYSGRAVTPPSNAGVIARVGGDSEQVCAGWWPGDERVRQAAFYAYAYPPPPGIADIQIEPAAAGWNRDVGEFLLPYDAVRPAPDPRLAILEFLRSTYAGAAEMLGWSAQLIRG